MKPITQQQYDFQFLGDSKNAHIIRSTDWEKKFFPHPSEWDQILHATLNLVINSSSAKCLLWGRNLVQFYNDSFEELFSTGSRIGIGDEFNFDYHKKDPRIGMLLDNVFKGKSFKIGDVYSAGYNLSFDFQPVFTDAENVGGILVSVYQDEDIFNDSFINAVSQDAVSAQAVISGSRLLIENSTRQFYEIFGLDKQLSLKKKSLFDIVPLFDNTDFRELVENVRQSKEGATIVLYEENNFKTAVKVKLEAFQRNHRVIGMVLCCEEINLFDTRNYADDIKNLGNVFESIDSFDVPAVYIKGDNYQLNYFNHKFIQEFGVRDHLGEVLDQSLFSLMPNLRFGKFHSDVLSSFKHGKYTIDDENYFSIRIVKLQYYAYRITPVYQDNSVTGLMVELENITEEFHLKNQISKSIERQKNAIESGDFGTYDWDFKNKEFYLSKKAREIFGLSDDYIVHKDFFKGQILFEDSEIQNQAFKECFETGNLNYSARFHRLDNTIIWLKISSIMEFDENKMPLKMSGTILDISEEKFLQQSLENEILKRTLELNKKEIQIHNLEHRYLKMLEEVEDYVILFLDKNGRVLNCNKGAYKIKGYKENEFIGKHIRIFFTELDKNNKLPEKILKKTIGQGRFVEENWKVRKDGSLYWANMVITALYDESNNVTGFSILERDLTESKIVEDKMKQYTQELEFQNKELEQFAYVASHDLQEPLRKIQTFTSMLQNNLNDSDSVALFLDKIKLSANRMSELIQAVLNYSKLNKLNHFDNEVDLNTIIEQCKDDFELVIREKNAVIRYEEIPKIKGIKLQLSQLIFNLISNSLKFNENIPNIRIYNKMMEKEEILSFSELNPDKKYIELKFEDNGIGFEKTYEQQIFVMFQRLHDKQSYKGTGIGLALCKRIVENHKGIIYTESELGKGSTFYIVLPVV